MTVNQILSSKGKEVYSVLSTNTVFEALTIMSEKNIGAILVIEETVLKGILSERDYANNIWSYDRKSKQVKQHTFHKDFDVKSLDAGQEEIVYEQGGYLHLLNPLSGKSNQLNIEVKGDFTWSMPRWETIKPELLTNPSLSPTGQ